MLSRFVIDVSEETLYEKLRPTLEQYAVNRPPMLVDEDAPVRAGQIRRLDPLPEVGRGQSALVLVVSDPTVDDLPDDITWNPGPCRITHVVLVHSLHSHATERDVLIPREAAGVEFEVVAVADSLCTVRLPVDDVTGRTRFGPMLGRQLPRELSPVLWGAHMDDTAELHRVVRDEFGWECGQLVPQSGDHAWARACRDVRNLNLLMGW